MAFCILRDGPGPLGPSSLCLQSQKQDLRQEPFRGLGLEQGTNLRKSKEVRLDISSVEKSLGI